MNAGYDWMSSTGRALPLYKPYESVTQAKTHRLPHSDCFTLNYVYHFSDYKCDDGNPFPIALLKTTLHSVHLELLVLIIKEKLEDAPWNI